jgi:hypothetical protein
MTSTQYVDEAAETAQSTINRATDVWKQSTEVLAKQADLWSVLPWVDPVHGVERYFEFVQTAVDANRELAIGWADAIGSVYGVVRDGSKSISRLGADQAGQLAEKAADTGKKLTEQAAHGAKDVTETAKEAAAKTADKTRDAAEETADAVEDVSDEVKDQTRRSRLSNSK